MNTLNFVFLFIVSFSTVACSSAGMRVSKSDEQRTQVFPRESWGGVGRH